ncbi:hypothetical protein BASA81_003916 [Batrachochytrium salamandrivorans]|nr:hypothetical protein BASA81_003916 [Batrachochytrium salamandrivorans]
MSICPNALAPLSEACGGGGVCVDAHTCLCPPGWSGRGDFVFGEPNCNIYLDAIRYEWVVVLLLRLLLLFAALNSARKSVHQNKLSGKPFFQSVSFGFSLGFAVDALAFGACAILKIIHPETQIGQDPGVTVAFVVGFFGFGAGMSLFMFAFVELNSKSLRYRNASFQDKFDKAIAGLKFQLFTSTTWALFCGALPLFMLACTSDEAIFGLALVYV